MRDELTQDEAADLLDSLSRARAAGLAKRFYERLLARDPRVKARFAHTDFERQSELLEHALRTVIENAAGSAVGRMAVARLGRLHGRHGLAIDRGLYDVWMVCFFETLAEADLELTPELARHWHRALDQAIADMLSRYDDR